AVGRPGSARPLPAGRAAHCALAAVPVPALVSRRADAGQAHPRARAPLARGTVAVRGRRAPCDEPDLARGAAPLRGVRRMRRALAIVRAQPRASRALALRY